MIISRRRRLFLLPILLTAVSGMFAYPAAAGEAFHRTATFRLGLNIERKIFGGAFQGGASVASADINADGNDEIIVGAGSGGGPHIEIYSATGTRLSSFFAFKRAMRSGLSLAAGDVDGDGRAEIVVGPRGGYPPEVQVYDASGRRIRSFLAFEETYTGGIEVAILPARGSETGIILVTSGAGREQEVRAYSLSGQEQFRDWYPHGQKAGNSLGIAAMWSDLFREPVLVTGASQGQKPLMLIHGLRTGRLLASWLAYDAVVRTGLSVAAARDQIVVGPGRKGGPEIRIFNARGRLQRSYYAFEREFQGGIEVALTAGGSAVATPLGQPDGVAWVNPSSKKIVVDLSDQRLHLYEGSRLVSSRVISSGKSSMPTPTGSFQIRNRISVAYSTPYRLYMEYWMAFSADGSYGLHALPFWKLAGGGRIYEGASHLGTPVSHGCIRQSLADAKTLFEWASIGTPVEIRP